MVQNLPSIAGDAGLIPGWRAKIPHATGQLSLCATTREASCGGGLVAKSCPTPATPWTEEPGRHPGFSRQEFWSGLPFPSPGDLPDPGIKPGSPSLKADSLPASYKGSPQRSQWATAKIQHRVEKQKKTAMHWESSQVIRRHPWGPAHGMPKLGAEGAHWRRDNWVMYLSVPQRSSVHFLFSSYPLRWQALGGNQWYAFRFKIVTSWYSHSHLTGRQVWRWILSLPLS